MSDVIDRREFALSPLAPMLARPFASSLRFG
jgi:hypothetical protein